MVFFTCSHCGESVKKPSVSKHYQTKCRNNVPFLTCVDCLKDFKGNEYEGHTKCVTEEERYSAKGFVPKASANKGEQKQKAWSECVQGLLSTGDLKKDEKNILQSIVKYDNIPRKKSKFMNFLKSSVKSHANNVELIDRIWEKLKDFFMESKSETQQSEVNETKESGPKEETTGRGCKRTHEEAIEAVNGDQSDVNMGTGKKKRKEQSTNKPVENGTENCIEGEREGKHEKKKKNKSKSKCVEQSEEPERSDKNEKNIEEDKMDVDDKENVESKKKNKKSKQSKEPERSEKNEKTIEDKMDVNDKENVESKKKRNKERKDCENTEMTEANTETVPQTEKTSFNWSDVISQVLLEKGNEGKIKLKKLQKKVLKEYCKVHECEVNEKTVKKFSKKLSKMDGLTVDGDYVSLNK